MSYPDDPTLPAGQGPYQYPPPAQVYPAGYVPVGYVRQTNTMAILSLVFAFVFPIAGIILGHMAKKEIRRTGEEGDGLATAGLVISYVHSGLYAVVLLIFCGIWGFALFAVGTASSTSG
jgi:hypothetical protein